MTLTWLNCSVSWLAVSLAAVLAAPGPARPSVLLITVDTLRPDALGWVAGRNTTPELDRLAREGFRFPAAVSPAPLTLPAHGSVMTGLVPRRHGMRDNGQPLPAGIATLAEALRKRGYATAAFVSGFPLDHAFGLDRGFERYDDRLPDGPPDRRERRAEATTAAAASWIASAREPWLLWVHYYDPHDPYDPPASFRRPGPRGAYDGEVAYADQAIATLRRRVEAGLRGRLLTVLAGDHGESLGEHGESTHGFFVYESTVAVPLVFHLPGGISPGESRAPARLVDVTPTILDLLGAPALPGLDGVSLAPLLSGNRQDLPPAYVETLRPWASYGWSPLRALRDGEWKWIAAPRPELFDLGRDPGESANRVEDEAERAGRMKALLSRVEAAPVTPAGSADPDAVERLRALGYVGAGGSAAAGAPPPGLPDPKDRIAEWNALGEAEERLERRDYRGALAQFDGVLATEPGNRFALARSGQALLELGRGEDALARMEKAVQSGPEHPESRLALAQALSRLGRHPRAVAQWTELTREQPRYAPHWVGLGTSLGLSGQPARAVEAFARAVELDATDPDLRVRLAFAEHAAGRDADAAGQLAKAGALSPPGRFAHSGALGLLLLKLGRAPEARRWLAASRPAEGDFAEARFQLALLEAAEGRADGARSALREALAASPALRSRAEADPRLVPFLPER
jgi:arylsulfatase A-like enzyme/tetratricopeptide (TPR) repeat protein